MEVGLPPAGGGLAAGLLFQDAPVPPPTPPTKSPTGVRIRCDLPNSRAGGGGSSSATKECIKAVKALLKSLNQGLLSISPKNPLAKLKFVTDPPIDKLQAGRALSGENPPKLLLVDPSSEPPRVVNPADAIPDAQRGGPEMRETAKFIGLVNGNGTDGERDRRKAPTEILLVNSNWRGDNSTLSENGRPRKFVDPETAKHVSAWVAPAQLGADGVAIWNVDARSAYESKLSKVQSAPSLFGKIDDPMNPVLSLYNELVEHESADRRVAQQLDDPPNPLLADAYNQPTVRRRYADAESTIAETALARELGLPVATRDPRMGILDGSPAPFDREGGLSPSDPAKKFEMPNRFVMEYRQPSGLKLVVDMQLDGDGVPSSLVVTPVKN